MALVASRDGAMGIVYCFCEVKASIWCASMVYIEEVGEVYQASLLAQLVERGTVNLEVMGLIPIRRVFWHNSVIH